LGSIAFEENRLDAAAQRKAAIRPLKPNDTNGPNRTFDQSIHAAVQLSESRRWSIPQYFKGTDGNHADFVATHHKVGP